MRTPLWIVLGLTIAAAIASAAQGQSPIQRIIAQENAKRDLVHRRQPLLDGRSPDTIDAAVQAHAVRVAGPGLDLRSPDTRDAAFAAHSGVTPVVVAVGAGGFDWGDAGIGGGVVFAIALLAASSVVLVREGRRQKAHG